MSLTRVLTGEEGTVEDFLRNTGWLEKYKKGQVHVMSTGEGLTEEEKIIIQLYIIEDADKQGIFSAAKEDQTQRYEQVLKNLDRELCLRAPMSDKYVDILAQVGVELITYKNRIFGISESRTEKIVTPEESYYLRNMAETLLILQ